MLDFWFDFASTYSYPAAMRIRRLADEASIAVRFRPFLLGPIFKAQGWTTSPFNLLARVALVGLARTWGEAFCVAVFEAQFGEGRSIADAIADILLRLDVAPKEALAAATSDDNKLSLRAQTEQTQRLGVFGAPTFIAADGELFWGNDRLERALLWAKQRS
jgi:2-hydroxychromene-2-carboxylate isomerase